MDWLSRKPKRLDCVVAVKVAVVLDAEGIN